MVLHKSFPWEEDDVLICPEVTVHIRLLPLLVKPAVHQRGLFWIARRSVFISATWASISASPDRSSKRSAVPSSKSTSLFSVIFLPGHVEVRSGTVTLKSTAREFPQPVTVSLDQVRMLISDVSPLFSFPFSVTARINGRMTASVFTVNGDSFCSEKIPDGRYFPQQHRSFNPSGTI